MVYIQQTTLTLETIIKRTASFPIQILFLSFLQIPRIAASLTYCFCYCLVYDLLSLSTKKCQQYC